MPSSTPVKPTKPISGVPGCVNVTERTVYQLTGVEQIPACRVGGRSQHSKVDNRCVQQQSMGSAEHKRSAVGCSA